MIRWTDSKQRPVLPFAGRGNMYSCVRKKYGSCLRYCCSSNALMRFPRRDICLYVENISLIIPVCGGHLAATSAEQHIYSHARFGDGNYGNKEDCDWIVEAPPGKNVHLIFRIFEMEDEQGQRASPLSRFAFGKFFRKNQNWRFEGFKKKT